MDTVFSSMAHGLNKVFHDEIPWSPETFLLFFILGCSPT
jgi:hypothetical protein